MIIKTCTYCGKLFDKTKKNEHAFCSAECKFFSLFAQSVPTVTGCIEWAGTLRPDGYGRFAFGNNSIQELAHRFSYIIHNKIQIPAGLVVCHICDNRKCINPSHFFLGTHADNVRDMVVKNRHGVGSTHSGAILTEKEVLEIRDLLAHKIMTSRAIAELYGITPSNVCHIKKRKLWSHI